MTDIRYGSDVIIDVLKDSGIRHVAFNPGATIRGLHESLDHLSRQGGPSPILCSHEEIAVGFAHGYAKAAGEPMAVALHNVVGLQHAAMAIFNAWCDRVPIVLLGGTGPMQQSLRRPWIDWIHTAYLQGGLVRDFVKWEVQVFGAESIDLTLRRAIKTATTAPCGPVYVCFDVEDQEAVVDQPAGHRPAATSSDPAVSDADVGLVLEWLAEARHPVVIADHYNTGADPLAVRRLAALAQAWAVPVIDIGGRHNMPSAHDLCLTDARDELLAEADLVLALDVRDLYAALRSTDGLGSRGLRPPLIGPQTRVVAVGLENTPQSSWVPDYFAPTQATHEVVAPSSVLVRELLRQVPAPEQSEWVERRTVELGAVRRRLRAAWSQQVTQDWDARPISTARLCAEIGTAMAGHSWVLSNCSFMPWPARLWDMDGADLTHIGRSGGEGLGYGPSASLGAALACKERGKIAVDIQGDGDLMFAPSALWTAAAYELPLLMVVHNNRSYYQDARHQREMSRLRGRGDGSLPAGIDLTAPDVGFVDIARGMGVKAWGPVGDHQELSAVLDQAVRHIAQTGRPALVDVISAPR